MTFRPLVAAGAACLASGCVVSSVFSEDLPATAEPHRARTDDGWELELVRYRPPAVTGPAAHATGRPVLLVHGMGGNARNLDLDDGHSLARWLAAHGREAWALSLRDTGGSDRADASKGRSADYSIDTYVRKDLPAAIRTVRQVSGAANVDYVGHSLGGIILYVYLATGGMDVGAGVALGSPGRFRLAGRSAWIARNLVSPFMRHTMSGSVEGLAHLLSPLGGKVELEERLVCNPEDISSATWRKFLAVGAGNVAPSSSHQLLDWVEKDRFASVDGNTDYAAQMAGVHVPVMVVAGKVDRIADAFMVKSAYRNLGGPKDFLMAGVENGFHADYGHLDLVVGDHVAEDLWPRIADFLDRYE
jgi:pimeloyl-ACP methyl ester carboxylesterase